MALARAPKFGGGWHAVLYSLSIALRVGPVAFFRALFSRNACKTCALGMGGQKGGMRDELGHFPEVCKKSLQAMAADMQGPLPDSFMKKFSVRQMQMMSPRELETAGRLTKPLLLAAGGTRYTEIGWDEALAKVVGALKAAPPERSFFYVSGRSSTEAAFLLSLFARAHGTNHVHNCSFFCHQASGVGLGESLGTGTATVRLADVEEADLFFLIGGNPSSNHPRLMNHLRRLRGRGGHVIVINPVREPGLENFRVPSHPGSLLFGSEIASLYVQVAVGGDIALMTGVAKLLLESGAVDREFIAASTSGFAKLKASVDAATWDDILASSGVTRAEIEKIAELYKQSRRTIFGWTMGITHHVHGVENVQWIADLALLRGMVGRPGAGLLPIRGHSNVQAMGSIGVTPKVKEAVYDGMVKLGYTPPTSPGFDTMACIEAAHEGKFSFGLSLGGNLHGSCPDPVFASEAMRKMDLMVYLSTALNTGHANGLAKETLILPVLARDEEPYKTTQESMFNYVRLSDGGKRRHVGPRAEVEVLAAVSSGVLGDSGPVAWSSLKDAVGIRALIARLVPGFERLKDIDASKAEFEIEGRVLHTPHFPTPDGKARFQGRPIPARATADLLLMTVRSEGQFNTVVYEDKDYYRGQERRDVILMHPDELARLGLTPDQRVTVTSAVGKMMNLRARPFDVARGAALMYYPEANVLVPRVVDPRSRTPAFKSVPITIADATNASRR